MIEARTGYALSTDSAEAAELYHTALDRILGSESGAAAVLDKALALDANFALAAAARFYVANDTGEADALRFAEQAEKAMLNASDWEREHTDILLGLIRDSGATKAKALAYIQRIPTDVLIVSQLAGILFFFDGPTKLQSVLNLFESVESALQDDWALLARLGFAASEAGQFERGRELLQRAFQIRPQSLYTIHGLAHLLHDEGKPEESAALLQNWLQQYGAGALQGQMYGHVQWHLALSEWQLGQREQAIERYQHYCAPATTTCGPILTLADCGGFLLRDFVKSGQVQTLGDDVLSHIERVWGMLGHPFVALHVAGLYASAADLDGLARCEQALLAKSQSTNQQTGLQLVAALTAYVKGEYQQAAKVLSALSPDARIGIGGSNVERVLVDILEASVIAHQSSTH